MIFNSDKKFIFVHIPKNAGNMITHTLQGSGHETLGLSHWHVTAEQIKATIPDYNKYFTFAFVRNPFDRLYSMYQYSVGLLHRLKTMPNYYENGLNHYAECTFKQWLVEKESWASWDTNRDYLPAQKEQQLSYISENGEVIVEFVGFFENLIRDFEQVCERISVPFTPPPRRNQSKRKVEYWTMYDDEMIDFVQHHHKTDLEMFGYSFPCER